MKTYHLYNIIAKEWLLTDFELKHVGVANFSGFAGVFFTKITLSWCVP